jgi:pantoate--beta-alanine ligase
MSLKEIRNPKILQQEMARLRDRRIVIGFVPTMGALHRGHGALISRARRESEIVVVSIFVNPTQFGPREDYRRYPRPVAQDRKLLLSHEVDYLFQPSVRAMYPEGFATTVEVGGDGQRFSLSNVLCGQFRPGHFRGVATIVTKLFHLVGPCRAYFGAKDYQQSVIVRRLIKDLNLDIQLRVLPTVREKDGLAISSRNHSLNPKERERARTLSGTLFWLRDEIRLGRRNLAGLHRQAFERLRRGVDRVDYLEIVDPESLCRLTKVQPKMVALTACHVGKTRLIDNVIIRLFKKD